MKEEEYHKVLEMINSLTPPEEIGVDKIKEFWKEVLRREKYEFSKQNFGIPSKEEG